MSGTWKKALTERIKDLLLELGKGFFSFMGSQYRLDVGGHDFYLCRSRSEDG